MTQDSETDTKLQRSLSLPLITCYGLGTIPGAGMTGLSYAELSSRLPYSCAN